MKKLITAILVSTLFAVVIVPLSSQAFIFNHREKCYGLKMCEGKHKNSKCQKDENGKYYAVMKKRQCNDALKKQ